MSSGISNFNTEKKFENIGDDDIKNNFVGVFPWNKMNKFIDHKLMISERKGKYPFIIANTDSSSKNGTHWWSILNIEPKSHIFFHSFRIYGLKNFITKDDKKIIEKILFGTDQMTRTDNKIPLVNINFNLTACKNLMKKKLDALGDTANTASILYKL